MSNYDLTTPQGVKSLMAGSTSEAEWNDNCNQVKAANKGYPQFWYPEVVMSGLMSRTTAKWGGSDQIKIISATVSK